ncbi:Ycf66 family protein [Agathobacter sp.]
MHNYITHTFTTLPYIHAKYKIIFTTVSFFYSVLLYFCCFRLKIT